MNLPPHPTYKREIAQLESYYKRGFQEIVLLLRTLNPSQTITRQTYERILLDISIILSQLDKKAGQWCEETIREAFEDSQARALVSMGIVSSISQARKEIATTKIVRDRAQQIIDDTFEDLLMATQNTNRRIKKIVREIVSESMKNNAIRNIGVRQNTKEIYDRLLKQGFSKSIREEAFIGIIDRAGRKWDAQTYSKMVVQTKIQQAQLEGARLEALENETDLAVISSHGAKDGCGYFEGMIVSLNGLSEDYPSLDEIRNAGIIFHPNCQHTVHPIGDISRLPQKLVDRAEKAKASSEYAMKNVKEVRRETNRMRNK